MMRSERALSRSHQQRVVQPPYLVLAFCISVCCCVFNRVMLLSWLPRFPLLSQNKRYLEAIGRDYHFAAAADVGIGKAGYRASWNPLTKWSR